MPKLQDMVLLWPRIEAWIKEGKALWEELELSGDGDEPSEPPAPRPPDPEPPTPEPEPPSPEPQPEPPAPEPPGDDSNFVLSLDNGGIKDSQLTVPGGITSLSVSGEITVEEIHGPYEDEIHSIVWIGNPDWRRTLAGLYYRPGRRVVYVVSKLAIPTVEDRLGQLASVQLRLGSYYSFSVSLEGQDLVVDLLGPGVDLQTVGTVAGSVRDKAQIRYGHPEPFGNNKHDRSWGRAVYRNVEEWAS